MSQYATLATYITRFGLDEAVQMLGDEQQLLTAQLLLDAIAGTWTGTPSAEQMAAATSAKDRLLRQLVVTSNFMDGYLRSVATLPLAPDDANAGTLEECCLALTRFGIADDTDNATERLDKAAETWRAWLKDVANGRVELVGGDGDAAPSAGRVRSGQAVSRYGWCDGSRNTGGLRGPGDGPWWCGGSGGLR